jgi:translocation and assembly module TamA
VALSEADTITAPDSLDITANLVEEKVRRISFSADLATQDGLSLGAAWMHRNLLGGAERLTLSGKIVNIGLDTGGLDYDIGATFDRPATFSPDTTFSVDTNFTREKQGDFRITGWNTTAGVTHYFSDTLTGNAGVTAHTSRVFDPSPIVTFRTLSFPFGLSWDTRDIKKNAAQGVFITAGAKPFLGFGNTDDGTRLVLDARGYKSYGKDDAVVFAARIQAGVILGATLSGTPWEDLFLSGGPATVRGQPYKSLGVSGLDYDSSATFESGGTHFLGGTFEGRFSVGRNLGMVGFVDVGQIDAGGFFADTANWHAGAGVGLRYLTAIGPIRLDVAGPIGGATGNGLQLYVGIGQAF